MNILHIDSSIQGDQSVTRSLSAAIVTHLRKHQPQARVTYRDVAAAPLPQFSTDAFVTDPTPASTRELAVALEEALAADVIVIGAPMYNFGVPSQLKSWLDALAIPGRTFRYSEQGVEGLLGENGSSSHRRAAASMAPKARWPRWNTRKATCARFSVSSA